MSKVASRATFEESASSSPLRTAPKPGGLGEPGAGLEVGPDVYGAR